MKNYKKLGVFILYEFILRTHKVTRNKIQGFSKNLKTNF